MTGTSVCNITYTKNFDPFNNPNDVYVGRWNRKYYKSKWSNPFKIGKDGDRTTVLQKYEEYIRKRLETIPGLADELIKLDGKRLGCWCLPYRCHAEILVKLINEYKQKQLSHYTPKPSAIATQKNIAYTPPLQSRSFQLWRTQNRIYITDNTSLIKQIPSKYILEIKHTSDPLKREVNIIDYSTKLFSIIVPVKELQKILVMKNNDVIEIISIIDNPANKVYDVIKRHVPITDITHQKSLSLMKTPMKQNDVLDIGRRRKLSKIKPKRVIKKTKCRCK